MKMCSKCAANKSESEFPVERRKERTFLRAECKECARLRHRKHNAAGDRKNYNAHKHMQRRHRNAELLQTLKTGRDCFDCKKALPWYVLDFDHRDPSSKTATISDLANLRTWRVVEQELPKCDLVCACCHRLRTKQQGGRGVKTWVSDCYIRNLELVNRVKQSSAC